MRRCLSISFCRVSFTGATSPVRAWGEQTVPTRSCSSADPGCAQPRPRAAQHGTAARAEITMHPALLNKAPSPTSCKNQSVPDSIYIGTVPRQREDLVHHTNYSPQRDKSVLLEANNRLHITGKSCCLGLLRSEILRNVPASWDFCCAQGTSCFGHFTLLGSFSVPPANTTTQTNPSQSPSAKHKIQIKGERGNEKNPKPTS